MESLFGTECRWELGEKFHRITAALRQPFLDFVAEVGVLQKDPVIWWSTRFSWKIWTASDLFLLVCYLHLAKQAIEEAKAQGIPLLIVVEDPWLLRQLKENFREDHPNVQVTGEAWLIGEKGKAVLVGLLKRLGWLLKTVRDYARQRAVWPKMGVCLPPHAACAVFSVPQPSSFGENGSWVDPYLPQIDEILKESGQEVVRFSLPESSGFERELAKRAGYFQPLILWATGGAVLRALRILWWPHWPKRCAVGELPIQRLCEREWWLEVSRSSLCAFRLFSESLDRMLAHGSLRWVVTFYENQPWEKLLALTARRYGVRVVSIQNAVVSLMYLSYFLGKGEDGRMPLPDRIVTSGPYPQKVLLEGGTPDDRLVPCGSIRYNNLTNGTGFKWTDEGSRRFRSQVLVVLPIDRTMAQHLLAAIRCAFPDGGREEGIGFSIRPHPMCPIRPEEVGFPARVLSSSFTDLKDSLRLSDLVLFIGSTVGLESLHAGKVVLRYRSELLLDVDEMYDPEVPVLSDDTLREEILRWVKNRERFLPVGSADAIVSKLFTPFNRDRFKEIFEPMVSAMVR